MYSADELIAHPEERVEYEETIIIDVTEDEELTEELLEERNSIKCEIEPEMTSINMLLPVKCNETDLKKDNEEEPVDEFGEPGIYSVKCEMNIDNMFFKNEYTEPSCSPTMNEDPNSNDQVFLCGRDFVQKCYLDMHMKLHEAKLPQKCETGSKKFTSKQHLLQHIDKFHESLHADENFQCSMYKKVFLRRHLLLNHRLRSHQRQYFCKYCPKSFSLQHNLVKNLKKHIPEEWSEMQGTQEEKEPLLCEICGKSFILRSFLNRHKDFHQQNHQCEVCGRRFGNSNMLIKHLKEHSNKGTFQCEICGRSFRRKYSLECHMLKHSDPELTLCDICGKWMPTKGKFLEHRRNHFRIKYQCIVCGKGFSRNELLGDHMKFHTKRPFKCSICSLSFSQEKYLKSHSQMHEKKPIVSLSKTSVIQKKTTTVKDDKPYRCTTCNKIFSSRSYLISHERSHTAEASLKCPICSKRLKTKLERHMKTHSEERPHECHVCHKRFQMKESLAYHLKTHDLEPSFICSVCSRGFFTQRSLVCHMKSHSEGYPFRCRICERNFYQMSLLQTHMRIHTGEKPFPCEICLAGFITKGQLMKHQKKNPSKEPFPCPLCPSQFGYERSLLAHLRTHTDKLFQCPYCDKAFKQEYLLKWHERVHTGERPYQCSVCKERFTMGSTLKRHMMKHTGERPFTCHLCSKSFQRMNHLTSHRKKVHAKDGATSRQICELGKAVTVEEQTVSLKKKVVIKVFRRKKHPSGGEV